MLITATETCTTGPRRSPEGCRDSRSTRRTGPAQCAGPVRISGSVAATCRQICVTTDIPSGFGAGFDSEIGLKFLELTPDGGTRPTSHPRQAAAAVGDRARRGLLLDHREPGQRVGSGLAQRERRRPRRRGQQQHRFPARHLRGNGDRGVGRPSTAAVANSCGSSQSPTTRNASSPAARCGCRTFRLSSAELRRAAEPCTAWQYPRLCD